MIAEKGIPTNGVYRDRNLNADVGAETHPRMRHWYNKLKPKVLQLARHSNRLVQQLLEEIETSIAKSSANDRLKNSAVEALRFACEEISTAFDILALELNTALTDCYFHFTTEEDIHCPMAREMAPIYVHAQGVRQGRGVYKRTRDDIFKAITSSGPPAMRGLPKRHQDFPVLENIKTQAVDRLRTNWKDHSDKFTAAVVASLQNFTCTSEQLLQNAAYATEQHKEARVELQAVLSEFKIGLTHLQGHFDITEEDYKAKNIKRESVEEERAVPTPSQT
jgi:hypothetical protein